MSLPNQITIMEVGPRDGLQNELKFISTSQKIEFINLLSETGLKNIEVTSFVSPRAIPQLADNMEVYQSIIKPASVIFSALVPNKQGMEAAIKSGIKEVAIFTAASEMFNQKNINCSISESIDRFVPIMELAKENSIKVRAYISCVLGCPYEGYVSPEKVLNTAHQLLEIGVDELDLGDTIGVGTPKQTESLIDALRVFIPLSKISMHFHDTYGQAIANIYQALICGVSRFDSSVAGLGGCPYARGASGNVATEDVLYLMHGLGIDTGIDIFKVVTSGDMICKALGRKNQSKVANALLANQ
ncbi:MAG: hydroxymethylglutaryl-CoA lyase [Legionellales bacterium RIFCSPHIGHO2_12_FULL_35_11]|nr:MAG: hydroxymethylglutaryl-CoA lyase [Legionellales bacterium RIFCSPHIGHO2_12_FULL_35_11]